jgi:hypothetical protein
MGMTHNTWREEKCIHRVLVRKPEGKNCSKHLSKGERIMLKWILKGPEGMGLILWFRIGIRGGLSHNMNHQVQ